MPELPEVETMRRGILGVIGSRIEAVEFPKSDYKSIRIFPVKPTFKKKTQGRKIVDILRIAKRVVLTLDNGDSLVFEPRMTGLVLLADPPSKEHLRVGFKLAGPHIWLWFWDRRGLGSVQLLSERLLQEQLGPTKLGPDALTITADVLRDRFAKSDRFIKVALLDQKGIAGIGNLYASEILHVAKIHPEKRCRTFRKQQWISLQSAIVEVLNEAILYEGSTLSDGTYRNALNQRGSYQNQHRVYGRKDLACPRCETKVLRKVHAQRSTFFCPGCQKK
jgi:formamidopyrimidine-DNA glycosylase